MEKAANNAEQYRKERKFVVDELGLGPVESIVRSHPAMFLQAYPPRYVNNIYVDTPDLENYRDNIVGSANRYKFRVRWYGKQFGRIDQPVLEIKIKKGLAGTKMHFPLAPFELKKGFSQAFLEDSIAQSDLPEWVRNFLYRASPTLLNRYYRKYFHSVNRKFRLTLDANLSFTRIVRNKNFFLQRIVNLSKVVIELKYDTEYDEDAGWISNNFPFRLSRNSKYINGIQNLDEW